MPQFCWGGRKVGRTWCWPYRGDTQATTHKRWVHLTYICMMPRPTSLRRASRLRLRVVPLSGLRRLHSGYVRRCREVRTISNRQRVYEYYISLASACRHRMGVRHIGEYGRRLANVGISAASLPNRGAIFRKKFKPKSNRYQWNGNYRNQIPNRFLFCQKYQYLTKF